MLTKENQRTTLITWKNKILQKQRT